MKMSDFKMKKEDFIEFGNDDSFKPKSSTSLHISPELFNNNGV